MQSTKRDRKGGGKTYSTLKEKRKREEEEKNKTRRMEKIGKTENKI